jgi:DNA-directed RNA polymerase subunit RPC12/RpoP
MANVCDKCGMEFDTPEKLSEHERTAHGAEAGKAICATCGMEFESQAELDAHAKSAHGA